MLPINVAREEAVRTAGEKYVLPPHPPSDNTALVLPALHAFTNPRKSPPEGSVGIDRSKLAVGSANA